jgi:hypothetical protein
MHLRKLLNRPAVSYCISPLSVILFLVTVSYTGSALARSSPLFIYAQAGIPARPFGVPAEAIWVGGVDGGVFVTLKPSQNEKGKFRVRVWNYPSGTLEYDGTLHRSEDAPTEIDADDRSQFLGWDGSALYLRNGGALRIRK